MKICNRLDLRLIFIMCLIKSNNSTTSEDDTLDIEFSELSILDGDYANLRLLPIDEDSAYGCDMCKAITYTVNFSNYSECYLLIFIKRFHFFIFRFFLVKHPSFSVLSLSLYNANSINVFIAKCDYFRFQLYKEIENSCKDFRDDEYFTNECRAISNIQINGENSFSKYKNILIHYN